MELSNRETRTAEVIGRELRRMRLEVRTGVVCTGVEGVLRGGRPGPVVGVRDDMDALAGQEHVGVAHPETGAADFSYFARAVPGFYSKLGAVPARKASGGHHTPTFLADAAAIPVGVRAMTAVVLDALRGPGTP